MKLTDDFKIYLKKKTLNADTFLPNLKCISASKKAGIKGNNPSLIHSQIHESVIDIWMSAKSLEGFQNFIKKC